MNFQEVTLSPPCYHSVRILFQEKHIAPFRVVRNFSTLPKSIIYWIFETSFIDILPWDSREWHWQTTPLQGTRLSLVTRLNGDIWTQGDRLRFLKSVPSSNNSISTIWQIAMCWPKFDTTPAFARLELSFGSPLVVGSLLALGSNAWGSLLRARSALMGFLNHHNTASLNVLKPNMLGRHTLRFGKNEGFGWRCLFLAFYFIKRSSCRKRVWSSQNSRLSRKWFLLGSHMIFLGVSFFISFGRKVIGCTLMRNTPPTMFSNKLGSLLLKLGWRPRKPSIPSNLLVSLVSKIVLIRLLRLNGATWIFLGRMALPLCGAFYPFCTF